MDADVVHSLWTVIAAVAAGACAADAARQAWRERAVRLRLAGLLCAEGPAGSPGWRGWPRPVRLRQRLWQRLRQRLPPGLRPGSGPEGQPPGRVLPPLLTAVAVFIFVGGAAGALAGLAAGYGIRRWLRRSRAAQHPAGQPVAELALAADLLAACLAAGAGPREAAEEVGRSLGGEVGGRLAQGAAELRLGGSPEAAWARLAELPGAAGLAGWLKEAGHTGVPVVDAVSRLAAGCRAEETRAATARARRAGVRVAGPLGLCFLPAFLAVGVAPVVMGLAAELLGGSR